MVCKHWMLLWAFLAIGVLGCGGSDETAQETQGEQSSQGSGAAKAETPDLDEGPRTAVFLFLEAMRRGDDAATLAMLTPLARREVGKLGDIQLAPKGTDTAEFTVGGVEYINQTGAQVAATWSDFVDARQRRTDNMLWMVRWTGEEEGWRVAGMAAEIQPGAPPLHLNFEDAEETLRQLDRLRAELTTQRDDPNAPTRR